MEGMKNMGFVG